MKIVSRYCTAKGGLHCVMDQSALPIDQGWAWIIAFACCGLFGLAAGAFKSMGMLVVELEERFPQATAPSLFWLMGVTFFLGDVAGPFVSLLILKTSHRVASVLGILLMVIGTLGMAYSPSVEVMYFTFGVFFGVGNGLVALTSLLATGPFFERRKGLAIGISAAGSGIGTLIIPNLLRPLFDHFDFAGALLFFAGFILQCLLLAALLRPMSFYKTIQEKRQKLAEAVQYRRHLQEQPPPKVIVTCYENAEQCDVVCSGSLPHLWEDSKTSHAPRGRSATFSGRCTDNLGCDGKAVFLSQAGIDRSGYTESAKLRPVQNGKIMSANFLFGSAVYVNREEITSEPVKDTSSRRKAVFFDWRLAIKPKMLMLCLSIFAYASGAAVAYQSIPLLGKATGVNKDIVSIMLSFSGLLELPCRVLNGWLADKKIVTSLTQYTICALLCGLAACLCASVSGLAGITIMLVGMVSVGTSVFSLIPIVCGEVCGSDNVVSAMGIQLVYQAAALLLSNPIAGSIYERFHQWEAVFLYISAAMWVGGLITAPFCLIHYLRERCVRRQVS